VPVGLTAMLRAIELNQVAIAMNKKAFLLGRLLAADANAVRQLTEPLQQPIQFALPQSLESMIDFRRNWLHKYQNQAYAERYLQAVRLVEQKEMEVDGSDSKKR